MSIQNITLSINEILSQIAVSAATMIPRVFWAFVIAVTGWFAAWILKKITLKVVHGLDQLLERIAVQKGMRYARMKQPLERFIGEAVFWLSFIFFLLLAVQILQLTGLSKFLQDIINKLPMLALGILIIVASFSIGSICRQIVGSAFQAMEIEQAELFGSGIKVIVIVIGILLGVAQFGIDISFLTTVVSISIGAFFGAIALAFGLGAQSYVANVLSSIQVRKIYQDGDNVLIDGVKGKIIEISSAMIILQTEEGQVSMPTKIFFERQSLLFDQENKNET